MKDNWSRVKVGKNWKNVRDNWTKNGRSATQSKAQGLKNADAASKSTYRGSRNSSRGMKGSRAGTKLKEQHNQRRNQRSWGKVGKTAFNSGKDWSRAGNVQGGTDS